MYAVIETGGKQYRVEVGTELEVERLEAAAGQSVTLGRVLLVADGDRAAIGRPLVAEAQVSAEVVRQGRGEKLIVFKYRPKARRRVKKGHRQELTLLRISDIVFDGRSAAEDARKAEEAAKTERQRLEEAAARQAAEDAAVAAKLAARTAPKAEAKADGKAAASPGSKAAKADGKAAASSGSKAATGTRARRGAAKADDAGSTKTGSATPRSATAGTAKASSGDAKVSAPKAARAKGKTTDSKGDGTGGGATAKRQRTKKDQ
jgi:large subunit ribosomal protein L21